MKLRSIPFVLLALTLLLPTSSAMAALRGQTPQGYAFIEGGIGRDEADLLATERSRYALSVRTAASGSGAYLSDVQLTIRDVGGQLLFNGSLDGPWLLIDLPPGRYVIAAVREGQVQQQQLTLRAGDHRECVLYFTVEGEMRPFRGDDTDADK